MSIENNNESSSDDVSQFTGAMDEIVAKYDQIIKEFTEILDQQAKKIFKDPKLEDKE